MPGLLVLAVPGAISLLGLACGSAPLPATPRAAGPPAAVDAPASPEVGLAQPALEPTDTDEAGEVQLQPSGMGVVELQPGSGPAAQPGDRVSVHYVGRLADGTEFDSTRSSGGPIEFEIGYGTLLEAFEQGVVGMQVGARRRLILPPALGYGSRGSPPTIPPDALLEFDVELIHIEPN